MKEFRVLAERPMQEIRSITTPLDERGKEVAGKTSVSGRVIFEYVALSLDEGTKLLETPPWDVTLYAYSPVDDTPYEAKVLGVQIVVVKVFPTGIVCDFVAAAIIPWKKA